MGWLCCPSHSFKHHSVGDDSLLAVVGVVETEEVVMWAHKALREVKAWPSSGHGAASQGYRSQMGSVCPSRNYLDHHVGSGISAREEHGLERSVHWCVCVGGNLLRLHKALC